MGPCLNNRPPPLFLLLSLLVPLARLAMQTLLKCCWMQTAPPRTCLGMH